MQDLVYHFEIAGFTENLLRTLWGIGGWQTLLALLARSRPEFSWVTKFHASLVPDIGMESWNGELHLAVEFEFGFTNHIAIFGPSGHRNVFTILIGSNNQIHSRDFVDQILKLLEKRSIKINRSPIIMTIPMITLPVFFFINRKGGLIGKIGEYGFTGPITGSFVELTLISPSESSSLSFLWTKSWRGNPDFIAKGQILICDSKDLARSYTSFDYRHGFLPKEG